MENKLQEAMQRINEMHKSHGIKQKGGKLYTQVVHRMEAFREVFGTELSVTTEILVDDGQRVVIKAFIMNTDGFVISTGMAEEIRGQGYVNTTSALENCETSAIGRALACLGLGGGEYASANEMDAVKRKTEAMKTSPPTRSFQALKEKIEKTTNVDELSELKKTFSELEIQLMKDSLMSHYEGIRDQRNLNQ